MDRLPLGVAIICDYDVSRAPERTDALILHPQRTAASTSASSNTMNGASPPSSMDSRFSVGADCAISSLPVGRGVVAG